MAVYFYVNFVYNNKFTENKKRQRIRENQIYLWDDPVYLTYENLREKLNEKFLVERDQRISYFDDDDDNIPIDSEYEFQEALKFAKTSSPNEGLVLIVWIWNLVESNSIPDMDVTKCDITKQEEDVTKQEGDVQNTMKMMFNCISNISTMTQSMTNMVIEMNERQRRFMVLNDTRSGVDDLNVSSRRQSPKVLHVDTSPPPWFIEYMESMKKEIVSTVTQEVVKQMMEMLNMKRMETKDFFKSFLSNETNQSKKRSHSSLSKKNTRCSFDSHPNEKNQKRINAQDEGHFSDASIERVDEPQDLNVNMNALKDHDRQLQQVKLYLHDLDNIRGQIHELLKEKLYYQTDEITNNLDMGINNRQERRQSVQSVNDNNIQEDVAPPICSMTSDALKILDGELRMNCSITGNRALNVDSFHENTWCDDLMEDIDKISYCSGCSIAADEREHVDTFVMVEMPMQQTTDSSLVEPKVPTVAELQQRDNSRDSPSFELLSETSSPRSFSYVEEEHFVNVFATKENDLQENSPMENPNPVANSTYMVDIHGKIYDEHLPTTPDTNIEFEKRSDGVYSFVAETLPVRETDSSKSSHTQEQTFSEQKNSQYNVTNSNDDELPSYSKVTTLCDKHQSLCDKRQSLCDKHQSCEKHQPLCEKHQPLCEKHHSLCEKHQLLCDEHHPLCEKHQSLYDEHQSLCEKHQSLCDEDHPLCEKHQSLCDEHHPLCEKHQSFAETFYWRTHSQSSKTDTNDFMQSFHSHTTSITDNNNDLLDKTKDTEKETTTSKKTTRHSAHDKKSKTRTDETCRDNSDKFSRSQQSSRTNQGSDGCSNGSRRTFGEQLPNITTDPVLILPETLLTMAAQVGSIAYVTARDMFDKLRSHAKEDPVKRRRVKLNTATDSCSSSSATRRPANQS